MSWDAKIPADLQLPHADRPAPRRIPIRSIEREADLLRREEETLSREAAVFEQQRALNTWRAVLARRDRAIRYGIWGLVLGWAGSALFWIWSVGALGGRW